MDDQSLVNEFLRTRSERAFRMLYRRHSEGLYRVGFRMLNGNKQEADELLQEMWCIAVSKLDHFEWRASLRTWLCAILINQIKEYKRVLARGKNIKIHFDPTTTETNGLHMDLTQAISKLPDGYRQVFLLHDVEGYKHHEIALILDINEGTSKSQLFNARRTLKNFLK
ncbi:MAG: RNA polymerase sigma factor [Cyclobacteriaceae bacterium]